MSVLQMIRSEKNMNLRVMRKTMKGTLYNGQDCINRGKTNVAKYTRNETSWALCGETMDDSILMVRYEHNVTHI